MKGKINGGVYQFSVPRKDPVTEDGMPIPPAMGTGTVINFQPTGGGKAAITGDFVITAGEVEPLIRTLRENRNRGNGYPQPHAQRAAAPLFRAFLGK